jgi:hypothetical protein
MRRSTRRHTPDADPFNDSFFGKPKGIWRIHSFVFSKLGAAVLIGAFLVIGFGGCMVYKSSEQVVTFTVEGKDRTISCDGEGACDSYWLVFTDKGVYKNDDDVAYGKFRSSDLQGRLKEGQTYTCKVAGWRVGFMSMYPNIIDCE